MGKEPGINKLIISIVIDLVGMATYAVPVVGEFFDVIWSWISGFLIYVMYKNKPLAVTGWIEELLPGTDFIPTATICWVREKWFRDLS